MTCFWNGILNEIDITKLRKVFNIDHKPRPLEFIKLLQKNAVKTPNILWNGQALSKKELDENLERIYSFNANTANIGYDCSCCDPYLLLCCQLFKISIDHNFNGNLMKYKYTENNVDAYDILIFGSDRGHFWASGKKCRR